MSKQHLKRKYWKTHWRLTSIKKKSKTSLLILKGGTRASTSLTMPPPAMPRPLSPGAVMPAAAHALLPPCISHAPRASSSRMPHAPAPEPARAPISPPGIPPVPPARAPSSFPRELLPPPRRVFLPGSDIPTPNARPLPSPSTTLPSVMAGSADAPPPTPTPSQPATKQLGFAGCGCGVVIDWGAKGAGAGGRGVRGRRLGLEQAVRSLSARCVVRLPSSHGRPRRAFAFPPTQARPPRSRIYLPWLPACFCNLHTRALLSSRLCCVDLCRFWCLSARAHWCFRFHRSRCLPFPRIVLFVLANSSSYFTTPFRLPSVLGNPILRAQFCCARSESRSPQHLFLCPPRLS
jgi:hypothetical protein